LKRGRVEFRNDRTGLLHVLIGKESFEPGQLLDNLYALLDAVNRAKPSAAKGTYLRTLTLTSTMGPGIKLDVSQAMEGAEALTA
jgi:large subunit ribosomal protein L1